MSTPTATRDPYQEEVSLAAYLIVLWRFRLYLLGVAVISGLGAFAVNITREPTFEATAKLMVSPSKIGQDAAQPLSVGTFVNLVNNQTLVLETVNELGLSKPPRSLELATVMEDRLRVEVVRDANVIAVKTQFWDAKLAADFANRLSERSVQLARRLAQEDTVDARDTIKVQLDQSKERLDEADRRREEFKRKAQVDLLTEDTDALLDQRAKLVPLLVQIEGERARVAKITEELARQQPVRDVRRSVDMPGPAADPPRPGESSADRPRSGQGEKPGEREAATPPAPEFRLRAELLDPYANPVYEMLQQQLAASRARLSGLEQERAEVMRVVGVNQAGVAKLSELYAKQAELARLQTEADLAKRVYEEVATRYEQARLQVAGRSPQLQVIDLAVPPDRPIGPRVLRNTVLATGLAVVAAAAGLLLLNAVAGGTSEAGQR